MISSLLHPTDFSTASERAFAHALRIALATKARFHIVHVDDPAHHSKWDDFPGVRSLLARWGMLDESADRSEVEKLGIDVVKERRLSSDPAAALAREVATENIDLVVMATHARTGLARFFSDSVAEPLVREGLVPTLLLPHGVPGFVSSADGTVKLSRVLIPVAATPRPMPAVQLAVELLRVLGVTDVEIRLLHVGSADDFPAVHEPLQPGIRWDRQVRTGTPEAAIHAEIQSWDPELVVMTSEGHVTLSDDLFGSTTERVVRQGTTTVLAVPVGG